MPISPCIKPSKRGEADTGSIKRPEDAILIASVYSKILNLKALDFSGVESWHSSCVLYRRLSLISRAGNWEWDKVNSPSRRGGCNGKN
jgi:hypothetical protein